MRYSYTVTDSDITVVIPSIPPRADMLQRAISSVLAQTHRAAAIAVAIDTHREGAAVTRNRALQSVRTPWTAFLDDDDEFMPQHLEKLWTYAQMTGADFVYSWFAVVGGGDPFPSTHFTEPFDYANPVETTITTLVRTTLAQEIGMQSLARGQQNSGEDYRLVLKLVECGAKIVHLAERTWYWHHDSKNTSGLPGRW